MPAFTHYASFNGGEKGKERKRCICVCVRVCVIVCMPVSHWLVYMSADMISISLLVLLSVCQELLASPRILHTHTHIHYKPHYMLTIAIILFMIRSDAPTCTRAEIHLRRPLEPHVFCVAVGHLPSLFISLHLNETLRDTMVLLQVNEVFKPSPHMDARAGGSRVVRGCRWSSANARMKC